MVIEVNLLDDSHVRNNSCNIGSSEIEYVLEILSELKAKAVIREKTTPIPSKFVEGGFTSLLGIIFGELNKIGERKLRIYEAKALDYPFVRDQSYERAKKAFYRSLSVGVDVGDCIDLKTVCCAYWELLEKGYI